MPHPRTTIFYWKAVSIAAILSFGVCIIFFISLATDSFAAPDLQITPTPTPDRISIFEDVTDTADVAFHGAQFGVSWGDYNHDGWIDLFVNNHWQDYPNVYHNNGDGTFTDVYALSNIFVVSNDPPISDPHGSSWGDYDNDGDLDFYINTGRFRINPFYVNQGNGVFVEQAVTAGIEDLPGRGRTANWIDFDSDGYLDLFKGNATRAEGADKLYKNNGNGTFSDVSSTAGISDTSGTSGNVWGDYDNDGHMDLMVTGGSRLRLYHNNGNNTFTDATNGAGITGWEARSWAADFGDFDNDGNLDLYIARGNYTFFDNVDVSNSIITYMFTTENGQDGFDFQNSGGLVIDILTGDGWPVSVDEVFIGATRSHPDRIPYDTLTEIIDPSGEPIITASDTGVFIWQDEIEGTWHFRVQNVYETQGQLRTSGVFSNVVEVSVDPPTSYNSAPKYNRLYKNQGNGTFVEIGPDAGVNSSKNSRTGTWLDYNNDGLLDLYVVNAGDVKIGNEANHLYRNNGDGTFSDVATEAGVQGVTPGLGDCAAWADYDRNGFLDLFVVTDGRAGYLSGPHKLFRNLGNDNHWLEIELVGTVSNRQGIGVRVDLSAGGITQTRQKNNGSHYWCQNSSDLHFGLGSSPFAEVITVTWPSGQMNVLDNQPVDRRLTIVEGSSPQLVAVNPPDRAVNVSLDQLIVVDFDKQMDIDSVECIITPTINITPVWSNNNSRLTLTHENSFMINTVYTVSITGQDLVGNTLFEGSIPNPWQFTTIEPIPEADLAVVQAQAHADEVIAGEAITYTIAVTNAGPTTPVAAIITNIFNTPVALAGVDGPGCTWMAGSAVVTCTITGVSDVISYLTLVVTTTGTYNNVLGNNLAVAPVGNVIDPNTSNNSATPIVIVSTKQPNHTDTYLLYLPVIIKNWHSS